MATVAKAYQDIDQSIGEINVDLHKLKLIQAILTQFLRVYLIIR